MKRLILFIIALVGAADFTLSTMHFELGGALHAQTSYRDYIRRGNRQYRDSVYDHAQVQYQKGFQLDSNAVQIRYNLGNSLLRQGQPKEAMQQYEAASKVEHNRVRRHQIFHNMGVILQSQRQFGPAIEAYKEALRCDPTDQESRYNLVLCQYQLEKNPQQNQNQQGNDQQKQDKQQDKQQQQKQDKQQNQQKKQEQQQQQPKENEMSRENAEQMLNAAMQDERQTQEKVKKQQQQSQQRRLQKQW